MWAGGLEEPRERESLAGCDDADIFKEQIGLDAAMHKSSFFFSFLMCSLRLC